MSVDTAEPDVAPISDAIAALEAETPVEPALVEAPDAPAPALAPVEGEAAAPQSRADKVRAEALKRKADREARMPVAEPPPRTTPNPLEEYQTEEIRRSVEFARLFTRNPHEAAKRAGLDPLKVAQLFLKEGQQPGTLDSERQQNELSQQLKAISDRLEQRDRADAEARQKQAQQSEASRLVNEFKALASNAETYPLLAGLDEAERMEEAGIAEQRYFRDYGHWPDMAEVAELVEDKLEKFSSRMSGKNGKGQTVTRGASRRTASQALTNDLAAETAASVELDMSDYAVMKRAEMALRRVGAE